MGKLAGCLWMVIDAREKCESLGIDYRDYAEATKISGRMFNDAIPTRF